jgi:hypothetical protein
MKARPARKQLSHRPAYLLALDRIVDQTEVVDLKHIRQQGCIGRLEEATLVTRAYGIGPAIVESQAEARRIMAGAVIESVWVRRNWCCGTGARRWTAEKPAGQDVVQDGHAYAAPCSPNIRAARRTSSMCPRRSSDLSVY